MTDHGTRVLGDYRIRTIPTGRLRENCYVIQHVPSAETIVVDPGEEPAAITDAVREAGGRPRFVVLTHAHYDHVGALAALAREFGVPFYHHPADAKLLRRAALYAMTFERKPLEAPGEGGDVTQAELSLGGRPVRTLHVPGHTEGGMAYGLDGFAFTGDTVLFEQIGRADLPGGDGTRLVDSVTRLLAWAPADSFLFPGHGRPWKTEDARVWWAQQIRTRGPELAVRRSP